MHRGICQFFLFRPSVRPSRWDICRHYNCKCSNAEMDRLNGTESAWLFVIVSMDFFFFLHGLGVCVLGTYLRLSHTHLKVRFLLFGQQPSSHRIFWAPESSIPFSPFDLQIQRLVPLCSATKRPPLHLWQIFNILSTHRVWSFFRQGLACSVHPAAAKVILYIFLFVLLLLLFTCSSSTATLHLWSLLFMKFRWWDHFFFFRRANLTCAQQRHNFSFWADCRFQSLRWLAVATSGGHQPRPLTSKIK